MRDVRKQIREWEEVEHRTHYSASGLALAFGISIRQLERDFRRTLCQSPNRWLDQLRRCQAQQQLQDGENVNYQTNPFWKRRFLPVKQGVSGSNALNSKQKPAHFGGLSKAKSKVIREQLYVVQVSLTLPRANFLATPSCT